MHLGTQKVVLKKGPQFVTHLWTLEPLKKAHKRRGSLTPTLLPCPCTAVFITDLLLPSFFPFWQLPECENGVVVAQAEIAIRHTPDC